jgi:hypothetical protein
MPPVANENEALPRPWIYAAIAALAVAIIAVAAMWAIQRYGSRDDSRLEAMQRELNAVQVKTQSAPAQLSGVAAAQGERIQAVQDRVAAVEAGVKALDGRLSAVDGRVATLEERAKKGTAADAELLIATAMLRDALSRGVAYAAPLDAVVALGKDDAALQSALAGLRANAAAGLPTAPMLAARFPPVADAIANAAAAPPGSGWWDRLWARLRGLVTVRRSGADAKGDSADAIAARAEAKVKAGDLAGAVAELDKLNGPPADAARPWLAQAKARLAADAALDALSAAALQRLNRTQ